MLTLLALGLRLLTFRDSLQGDELFMYSIVHGHSLGQALHIVRETEKTPPLMFVLNWFTSRLGDSTLWIRLPSLICGVGLVPLVYALGRRISGRAAGLLAAALVTLSGFGIFYAVEDRAYAGVAFFSVLSTVLLLRAVDSERRAWWAAYALAVVATMYTHYVGFFVIAAQVAWVVWTHRRRLRTPLAVYGFVAVAYLPWVPSYLLQQRHSADEARRIATLAPPNLNRFGTANAQTLFGHPFAPVSEIPGSVPLGLAIGAVVLCLAVVLARLWAERASRPWRSEQVLLVLLALAAPIGIGLLSVRPHMSFLLPRNLSSSYPMMVVLLAVVVIAARRVLAIPAALLLMAVMVITAARSLEPDHRRNAYRDVAHFIEARSPPSSPLIQQFFLEQTVGATAHPVDINFRHPRYVADDSVASAKAAAWAMGRTGVPVFVVVDLPEIYKGIGKKALPVRNGPGGRFVRTDEQVYPGMNDLVVAEYRYAPR